MRRALNRNLLMKTFLALLITILISFYTMGQNKHPMKIAMVSVFVADPVKAFKYYTEVLGFEEVMYSPENYIAIVKSPLDVNGTSILLEPTEPGGIEIARKYKQELYAMGIPVISFSSGNIQKTAKELKKKGVKFKKDLQKTDWGYEAVFDDAQGNYIQLIQFN
jgi:predicted enzyme related to lactoylglutathione lyase